MRKTSLIEKVLDVSAEKEGKDLPNDDFVAKKSTGYKMYYTLISILGIVASIICWHIEGGAWISISLSIISLALIFFLPTLYSYKAYINREVICEEYLIVFIKKTKEIEWKNIKYKKIVSGTFDEIKEIEFYDENKKCLAHFEKEIVGFTRIVKMAKKAQ